MEFRYVDEEPPVKPWADSRGPDARDADPGPPEVMVTRSCCYRCPGQDKPECCAHGIYLRMVTITRELPSDSIKPKSERLTFRDYLEKSNA